MFDIKQIVRPNILGLEPYRCARDDFKTGILLDANENTHGPALANISQWENSLELNRYPDPHQIDLKQQLVDYRNKSPNSGLKDKTPLLKPGNLCLGVGSDESIDLLIRCVCAPGKDKMLVCPPTYGMYSVCATVNDVELVKVPLSVPGFDLDTNSVVETLREQGDSIKLMYLTSPGNPTGKLVSQELLVELLEEALKFWNGLIVVDEAYVDFVDGSGSASAATLVNQYPNLVVMQTLSKSFGLAGIRLGVTFCSEQLSYYLNSMKYPYNISSMASDIALRATNTEGLKLMETVVDKIVSQRGVLLQQLQKLDRVGENIGGLDSNFILLQILDKQGNPSNQSALNVYHALATENEVVVRFRGKELNCEGALRISVGTAEENKTLVEKFEKVLQEVE